MMGASCQYSRTLASVSAGVGRAGASSTIAGVAVAVVVASPAAKPRGLIAAEVKSEMPSEREMISLWLSANPRCFRDGLAVVSACLWFR
jgi:hypothetical protein